MLLIILKFGASNRACKKYLVWLDQCYRCRRMLLLMLENKNPFDRFNLSVHALDGVKFVLIKI